MTPELVEKRRKGGDGDGDGWAGDGTPDMHWVGPASGAAAAAKVKAAYDKLVGNYQKMHGKPPSSAAMKKLRRSLESNPDYAVPPTVKVKRSGSRVGPRTKRGPDAGRKSGQPHASTRRTGGGELAMEVDGIGTEANPIQVDSASKALDLIQQGVHVKMNPETLSVMLDKLSAIGKECFDKGIEAPDYDLCRVHVPDSNIFCEANRRRTRIEMPQLAGSNIRKGSKAERKLRIDNKVRASQGKDPDTEVNIADEFVADLIRQGVSVGDPEDREASLLKATQSQIVGAKVGGMMASAKAGWPGLDKPIFISNDGYILDGHHRWAAKVGLEYVDGQPLNMSVRVIDLPIEQLLGRTSKFTEAFGVLPKGAGAGANIGKAFLLARELVEKRNYNIPSPLSSPKEIVGSHNHRPAGTSIRWPAMYRELRKKGYSKRKAAMISNGKWRKKHGLGPASVRGAVGKGDRMGHPFRGNQWTRRMSAMLLSESVLHAGATMDWHRHTVTSGYAVSEHEERSGHWDVMSVNLGQINDWIVANTDLFKEGKKVGAWLDNGELWLDPSTVFPNTAAGKHDAIVAGRDHNQKAIASLDAIASGDWDNAFISTGGTGEVMSKSNHPKRPPDVILEPDAEAIMAWIESVRVAKSLFDRYAPNGPDLGHGNGNSRLSPAQLAQRKKAAAASAAARRKRAGRKGNKLAYERGQRAGRSHSGNRRIDLINRRNAIRQRMKRNSPKQHAGEWAPANYVNLSVAHANLLDALDMPFSKSAPPCIGCGDRLPPRPASLPPRGEVRKAAPPEPVEEEFTISKTDNDKQLVFGWAYVSHDHEGNEVVDKSGDYIEDPWELEEAAYRFVMHSRQGGQDHARDGDSPVVKSTMVESMVFTPEKAEAMGIPPGVLPTNAWWCGFKVEDPTLWQGVKDGRYTSFSIHGSGVRHPVEGS